MKKENMKTTIYTYRNKKVVLITRPRFYVVRNQKELDEVIDGLMDVDAVISPVGEVPFPAVIELESGFGPNLLLSTKRQMKKALAQARKELDLLENDLNS